MKSQSRLINRKAISTTREQKNSNSPSVTSHATNNASNNKIANSKQHLTSTPSSSNSNNKSGNSVASANKFESNDQICNICTQNVPGPEREKIFAFGKCDHHVCYVCSARLRAICEQSECPICREKLDCVLFTSSKNQSFEKYTLKNCLFNEKFKIYFVDESIKLAFEKLLRFDCQICTRENKKQETANADKNSESPQNIKVNKVKLQEDGQGLLEISQISHSRFEDVFGLKNHLNFVHKLKLCDLCLTHNKLFPFEYSYYDKAALKKHIEKGEPKTSHRGHPVCTLCQQTFFNAEELILHMSREHFHCHLCGRHETNRRIYFSNYLTLREHFKTKHILCERDNCKHEQFTSVFDNEIDYRMHLVEFHPSQTSGLSRGEVRQQRTITLEQPAYRSDRINGRLGVNNDNFAYSSSDDLPPNTAIVLTGPMATANSSRQHQNRPAESLQAQLRLQRLPTRAEFPALGQTSTNATSQAISLTNNSGSSLAQSNSNGASMARSSPDSTLSQRLVAGSSSSSARGSFVRTLGGGYRALPGRLDEMDFPPLPEQPKVKPDKKSKCRDKKKEDDTLSSLEQLIGNSLNISKRGAKMENSKRLAKGKSGGSTKAGKQKPIKIQL